MPPETDRLRPGATLAPRLVAWYRKHRRDLPWRRTNDPYAIWIAEVMLQQTTVQAVIPYFSRFMKRFPNLRTLARARPAAVLTAWSGLGYYRRARHLHAAARRIEAAHDGRVPDRIDDLLRLPGIGRYTAGAILSIAFGQQQPILDGNVARVLSRLRCLRGDPRSSRNDRILWSDARVLVEASDSPGDLNQALMELGATVCTPATPRCGGCPVARSCRARRADRQSAIPPPRRTRPTLRVPVELAVIEREGRILMRRRKKSALLDNLWELPSLRGGALDPRGKKDGSELKLRRLRRIGGFRHTITYRRMEVDVYRARLLAEPRGRDYRWVSPRQASGLPISSLVSKALDRLRD